MIGDGGLELVKAERDKRADAVLKADAVVWRVIARDVPSPGTRRAMLEGVRANTIVVGAYTDSQGGICPMLAAHRNGGRTDFLSFARAWDAFARAEAVRRATPRELRVLEAAGIDQTVICSDLGQVGVFSPLEGFRRGVALCMDLGYSDEDIHKMVATNASRMLDLEQTAA